MQTGDSTSAQLQDYRHMAMVRFDTDLQAR